MYVANISSKSFKAFLSIFLDIKEDNIVLMDERVVHKANVTIEEATEWVKSGEAIIVKDIDEKLHYFYPGKPTGLIVRIIYTVYTGPEGKKKAASQQVL
jgi:hypothetical protein